MPLFNSQEYSWSNVSVVLAGKKLTGIQGVKYKWTQDKERVFGAGNKARAIQHGNLEVEGEIMLLQNEYNSLHAAARVALDDPFAKVGDLSNLQLVVAYTNGAKITTTIVYGVSFTEAEESLEQNDKFMKITLPFLAIDFQKDV